MKNKLTILLMVLIVAAALSGCKPGGSKIGAVAVGLPAPDFSLVDMKTGKQLSSSELRGKVIFVHFWATWCQPCREELPLVNAMGNDAASLSNFVMATVLYQDSPENAVAFMKTMSYSFPVNTDPGGTAAKSFGVTGVPETYIIDKKGVLRRKVIGAADWGSAGERQLINSLLKE